MSDDAEPVLQKRSVDLSKDVVFGILRNSRRRKVLRYLDMSGGRATLSDLAEYVVKEENDLGEGMWTSKQRKGVYISLYQSHLPKMRDAGFVTYDDRKIVERCESARVLEPFLNADLERGVTVHPRNVTEVASRGAAAAVTDLDVTSLTHDQYLERADDGSIREALIQLATAHPGEFASYVANA